MYHREEYGLITEWDINVGWFDRLEKEYGLFLDYASKIRCAVAALENNTDLYGKMQTAWLDLSEAPAENAAKIAVPETADLRIAPWIRLILLLPFITPMMNRYRDHGYSEEEIRVVFHEFYDCIAKTAERTGTAGLTDMYFDWAVLFIREFFFRVLDFRFELAKYSGNAVYFRSKTNGGDPSYNVLASSGLWHRSGMAFGSALFEEAEGAFHASLTESPSSWSGNSVEYGLVLPGKTTLRKAEWEKVLGYGDPVLKIHIDPGADITAGHVAQAAGEAVRIAKERFGHISGILCESWLLDPVYRKVLGDDSRIAKFGEQFIRFPQLSNGLEIMNFVFEAELEELPHLPAGTRLTRALKELYLAGGRTHAFEGMYAPGHPV